MSAETAKPKCPGHPTAAVLSARKPGDERERWVCLECGKRLGDAGPASDNYEKFTIHK